MTIKCEYCDRALTGNETSCPGCGCTLHLIYRPPNPAEEYPQAVPVEFLEAPMPGTATKNKIAAGLLAILLGSFGIHKFYLGNAGAGTLMLLLSLLSCFHLAPIVGIIALAEGIIYLTKSDRDFFMTYEVGKKAWF